MTTEFPIDLEAGFDRLYGLQITEFDDGLVRCQVQVRDELKQPGGFVHGGVYAAIAESLASSGTAAAMMDAGNTVSGLSNQTSSLRPITQGTIHGVARTRHRGRTTWVWEVELTDDAGRLCALTRVTIAVRPTPPGRARRPRTLATPDRQPSSPAADAPRQGRRSP